MKKQTHQEKEHKEKQGKNKDRLNTFFFHFGNFLIIGSMLGFTFIFYPLASVYFSTPLEIAEITATKGTYLTIPKINAQAEVITNVDPWDEKIYDEALKKGVAHAKGTVLPGIRGTSYLFAHSSGMPWDMTHMNTVFLRLGELQKGDIIIINREGRKYQYQVRELKEVTPSEVQYLLEKKQNQLILQTCTPIGTSINRLLVFADPI